MLPQVFPAVSFDYCELRFILERRGSRRRVGLARLGSQMMGKKMGGAGTAECCSSGAQPPTAGEGKEIAKRSSGDSRNSWWSVKNPPAA